MYCITLKGSRRRGVVEREFERVGLHGVQIVERERDSDGKRGCFQSHQHVLKLGLQHKFGSIVVFEDDVEFRMRSHSGSVAEMIHRAKRVAEARPGLVVGLGGFVFDAVGDDAGDPNFRFAPFALTHAYVVSAATATEISSWNYDDRHIDKVFLASMSSRMAILVPSIAFQRGYFEPSEITTTESTWSYFFVTALRNIVSSFAVQVAFELVGRARGAVRALVR